MNNLNIISTSALQRNIKAIFQKLQSEKNPLLVVRDSIPEAVLVPYAEYKRLSGLEGDILKQEMRGILNQLKIKNAKFSSSEVDEDINHAKASMSGSR